MDSNHHPYTVKIYFILALILPVFALAPLLYPGYIQTHTGLVPLWNVADLRANIGDFLWTPHIATNFNPLRSNGLLPYYLAAILPLSPANSVKLVMGAGWLLGGMGMFLWLRSWLGNPGAVISALVYIYLPHQIATVYVRGAWGETLFWGGLPWAILVTTYFVTSYSRVSLVVAAAAWFMLGLSQLGLTIWAFIFIALLLLIIHRPQSLPPILSALVGTVAAAGLTLTLASPSSTAFNKDFLYPFQLFSAYWGFGVSQPGWNDGLSFQLGVASVGLTIITIALWQNKPTQTTRTDRRLIFFLAAAVIFALLQFSPSDFIWNMLPNYTLTYSWQLLGFSGLSLSVMAGASLWLDKQLQQLPIFVAVIIFVILSSHNYLIPQFTKIEQYQYPEAELGTEITELTILSHSFSITNSNKISLEQRDTAIPLAVYGTPQAGDTLLANITWHPVQKLSKDYKLFVHLVDANNNILVQYDGHPLAGTYPTSRWIKGEIIEDSYPLLLPDNISTAPTPYRVFAGLYDEQTGIRLPVVANTEGKVTLDVK